MNHKETVEYEKYPCNHPLRNCPGKFSATPIIGCMYKCSSCGFNPEEAKRRLNEGEFRVLNSPVKVTTIGSKGEELGVEYYNNIKSLFYKRKE